MVKLYLMHILFDIEKIRRHRRYALKNIQGHDFLFVRAADRLADNLRDIKRDFHNILIVGCRGADRLRQALPPLANVTVYDVMDGGGEIPGFAAGRFDCIVCLPYLHTVNDVPGFLVAMKTMLQPDGVFLCCFFGGQTLQELRQAVTQAELDHYGGVAAHIHPMIDHEQFAALMQRAGFALPVVDFDRTEVGYSRLETLYEDLHCMGEGNALIGRDRTLAVIREKIDEYYRRSFYDHGYHVTFDLVFGIGWSPHSSQQKPAPRGSGTISLEDILE